MSHKNKLRFEQDTFKVTFLFYIINRFFLSTNHIYETKCTGFNYREILLGLCNLVETSGRVRKRVI